MRSDIEKLLVADELIMSKIYIIRGQKVMIDSDLADLYHVPTKRLKEQVRRNKNRFPEKYMFELNETEFHCLRSQIATSNNGRGGVRYLPMVFTEHGILQLSNVLTSERAIKVSFAIIDVFIKLRDVLLNDTELRLGIEEIRKKTENNTRNIELVFQYLDELLEKRETHSPREKMGYKFGSDQ